MGTSNRPKPIYLAEKLKKIRQELGFTYEKLIEELNCPEIALHRASISQYEKGHREPPLKILLKYAQLANVYVDVLIDDDLDLPHKLPSKAKLDEVLNRNS
jgi:transcriptional regulator with XRE-family HTH domain